MKDRLITLAGALFALYILVIILVPGTQPGDDGSSVPTSIDDGQVGLLGLYRWLQQGQVPVYRLRQRYGKLTSLEQLPIRGNLMVVVLPQITPARRKEMTKLKFWLSKGNQLLILTAYSDSSIQSFRGRPNSYTFLSDFGFFLDDYSEDEDDEEETDNEKDNGNGDSKIALEDINKTIDITLVAANRVHPLLRGIKKVHAKSKAYDVGGKPELVSESGYRSSLSLLSDAESGATALWEVRYRNSRVWISRFAHLFGNAQLGEQDNARLIANIISSAIKKNGVVVFDDMHQGYSELYDPDAFFDDPRLHNSLWFIFSFWLLYVVGHSKRLAPLADEVNRPKTVDYIYAMANLFARRLNKVAAARLLFSHFLMPSESVIICRLMVSLYGIYLRRWPG